MALPVLEKTYTFSVNELHGGVDPQTDHEEMLFAIKDRFTSYANSPWTVHSSSNASSAGISDYWASAADVNWSYTGAHGWIVLTMPNGGQVLLDCQGNFGNDGRQISVYYSPSGIFDASGATTSTPPTAADQTTVFFNDFWFTNQGTAQSYRLHFIHSNDGQNSMVIGFHNNINKMFMGSLKVQDPVPGWDYPHVFHMVADVNNDHMTYAKLRAAQLFYSRTKTVAGMNFAGALTCEGFVSNAIGEEASAANAFSNDWPMSPIGFASNATGARGRHGRIADLWYGSTALNSGDTIEENPVAPTRSFAQFGDLIVPWDGSVPLIA